jgi:hypothetical protein
MSLPWIMGFPRLCVCSAGGRVIRKLLKIKADDPAQNHVINPEVKLPLTIFGKGGRGK